MKLSRIKRIHFIGIGGVGMVGIAEILIHQGYKVTGSDLVENKNTERLKKLKAKISIGHQASNVGNADVVVYSSAVNPKNPEMLEAKLKGKIIIPRAEMLSSLMKGYQSIAVAGSHGKTTTTSLIANIFSDAEFDPTYIIGGKILGKEERSILGSSDFIIVEADESDGSFLHLNPEISVLTNIDNDHLDFYDNKTSKLEKTFLNFMEKLPFFGTAVICTDCLKAKKLFKKISRPKISYGFNKTADYQIVKRDQHEQYQAFTLLEKKLNKEIKFKLKIPGQHNALNSVAAFIVSNLSGIKSSIAKESLEKFTGVSRRLEPKGLLSIAEKTTYLLDDYGHHPTEIKATISAVRQSHKGKKINMIFQPHRYSRSTLLFNDFIDALSNVDKLIVMDIYSAGEENPNNISSYDFVNSLLKKNIKVFHGKNLTEISKILEENISDNEILITQGAGNVADISNSLVAMYK